MFASPGDYKKQELKEFVGHKDEVNCVSYSSDFSFIVTGSDDQRVRLFNVKNKQCVVKLKGHEGAIKSVAVSPCDKYFASGSFDKTARIWRTANASCLHVLERHKKSIETVIFSPKSDYLCTGSWDRTAVLWCVQSGGHIRTLRGHDKLVQSVAFSFAHHNFLASGSWDYTVRVWVLKHDRYKEIIVQQEKDRQNKFEKNDVAVNKTPEKDRETQGGRKEEDEIEDAGAYVQNVGEIDKADVEDPMAEVDDVKVFLGHTGNVHSVAFSKLGMLASGSWDRTIRLWNPWTGICLCLLKGHVGWVRVVCFSPDASYVASAADDDYVKVWDIASGKCVQTLEGLTDLAQYCSFTPSGELVASGAALRTLKRWPKKKVQAGEADKVEQQVNDILHQKRLGESQAEQKF